MGPRDLDSLQKCKGNLHSDLGCGGAGKDLPATIGEVVEVDSAPFVVFNRLPTVFVLGDRRDDSL